MASTIVPPTWPFGSTTSAPSPNCSTAGYCLYRYAASTSKLTRVDLAGAGGCSSGYSSGPTEITQLSASDKLYMDAIYQLDQDYYYYSCCDPSSSS